MPRNSRRDFPGLFHHIMSQGINKEYIFDNDKLKKMYIDLIKEKSEKNNVKIMAYCIMDNHVHMLINVDKIEQKTVSFLLYFFIDLSEPCSAELFSAC